MRVRSVRALLTASLWCVCGVVAGAQGPKPRLAAALDAAGAQTRLAGTRPGQAQFGTDMGAVPADTAIKGITLVLNRSEAQQAALDTLLAAQANPASPQYHKWLTPDEFGQRFGVADADLSKIEAWLQAEGFQVSRVARSRNQVFFDGTASQVDAAFGTELHRYAFPDRVHFAPNSDLSVPAALAPLVTTVTRLADFRPHPQVKLAPRAAAKPAYTSAQTGNHFLTPGDLATMYDANSLYKAGFNGAGQGIAILGQTFITSAAITAFQTGAGLTANLPTMVMVPDTGVNAINYGGDGDEGESQLDVEYSAGMAPGATIYFVYTGDNSNAGVFDSLSYAIDEDLAPVISGSYGVCETEVQGALPFANALSAEVQQANAQGQTVLFASGDEGSTSCYGYTDLSAAQQGALVASFPATVPNITAVGGTQMATGTFASTNTQYWATATGSDAVSSLLSYVPEAVWNEDAALGNVYSGGGGVSSIFARPSWQAGVTGIPAGANRLVPDIAFQSSLESPGYIFCTDDPSDLNNEDITASCTNGLRSSSGTFLVAGGTSFATPAVAGLLAVLNQAEHAVGQGNLNPTLYTLASNATTYASVFHDITSGSNACEAGSTVCTTTGASAYAATAGYDEATGLGSFDFANLVTAWPATSQAALAATTVHVSPATTTPTAGAADVLTITVASQSGTGTPTGTVAIVVDGDVVAASQTLVAGATSFVYTAPAGTGSHAVTVVYAGDVTFAASQGSAVLTTGNATPSGTFTVAAQALTVAYNGTASTSFTLTPGSGYTGAVVLSLSLPSTAPTLCYDLSNPNSSGFNVPLNKGTAVTGTLEIGEGTQCTTSASGAVVLRKGGATTTAVVPGLPTRRGPAGIALAGLLMAGLAVRRRSRRLPALLGVAVLGLLGLGLSGCGGSSTGTPTPVNSPQTVTVTLSGVDSVNSSIANSTTFTLTIN